MSVVTRLDVEFRRGDRALADGDRAVGGWVVVAEILRRVAAFGAALMVDVSEKPQTRLRSSLQR